MCILYNDFLRSLFRTTNDYKSKKTYKNNFKKYFVIVPIFAFASYSLPTESFLEKITNNKVLSGDEAFTFSAHIQDDESIILTWTIKENCFLYKDKFKTYLNTRSC